MTTSLLNPCKNFVCNKCYSCSNPTLIKNLQCYFNVIWYNYQKIYSWTRSSETILYIRKKSFIFDCDQRFQGTSFSRNFLSKRLNKVITFGGMSLPNILNAGAADKTFQQSGKQDSFKYILNRSTNMYERSRSQLFRIATGVQSGPDAFAESRLLIIILTK